MMLTSYKVGSVFGCSVIAVLIRTYNAEANILIILLFTCGILHKTFRLLTTICTFLTSKSS